MWNTGVVYGERNEPISCSEEEDGKLAELILGSNARGIFFGHDHNNDFVGNYQDRIHVGYGRKSGYAGYSPRMLHGARVIQIQEHPFQVHTWIRNEEGNRESQKRHDPDKNNQLKCRQEPVGNPSISINCRSGRY